MQSYPTPEDVLRIERMSDSFTKYHLGDGRVLHHFTAASDEHYHDHPFFFQTTILSGGYREEIGEVLPDGTLAVCMVDRLPNTTHLVQAVTIHKLVSLLGHDCWTLIQVDRKERESGFYRVDEAGVWHQFWHQQDWTLIAPALQLV